MSINPNKYIDIHIENGQYWITQTDNKPKSSGSALSTLKNIEKVLSQNLTFIPERSDEKYSTFKQGDTKLLTLLKDKSVEIAKGHKAAVAKTLLGKIFNDIQAIKAVKTNIKNLIEPSKFLNIDDDMVYNELIKHLPQSDMIALSMVNRAAQSLTPRLIMDLANDFGIKVKITRKLPAI